MTQIKICGITNEEDALCSAILGAAALGFIFYLRSPRYIKPEDARKIVSMLPDEVAKVGVFVDENAAEVKRVVKYCGLDFVQLHGNESPEYCFQFPAAQVIKAVQLKNDDDLNHALSYDAAAILVDSRERGLYGGTGKKANWDLASRIKNKKPLILSGGLDAENIREAMEKIAPHALDINSGVEKSPGKKDQGKLAKLFDIVHEVSSKTDDAPLIFAKRKI